MPKFDREKFNSDPKHEEERNAFDTMVGDAFERIAKKKAEENKNNPPKAEPTFFDSLLSGFFGDNK